MQLSAKAIVGWALQIEANGASFYRAVAADCGDREARALFEDLAEQEQRHYRTFERLLAQVPDTLPPGDELEGYQDYLRRALAGALIGGPEKGLELAKRASDEQEALAAALAFEKDTLLFFYDLRALAPAVEVPAIEAVIAEEKLHVRMLALALEDLPWVS